MAQHRSLVEGSAVAAKIDAECADCDAQASQIRCSIQNHWNEQEGFVVADVDDNAGRSGKGIATVLSSIHSCVCPTLFRPIILIFK